MKPVTREEKGCARDQPISGKQDKNPVLVLVVLVLVLAHSLVLILVQLCLLQGLCVLGCETPAPDARWAPSQCR